MIPIPAWLIAKAGPKVAQAIVYLVAALVVIGLLVGLYFGVKNYFTADLTQRVKTITAQASASQESGHDAVQTVGNTMGNDQAADAVTAENGNVIDHAKGTTDAVDPAARAAGLQSLCRRTSYRNSHPSCVQHAAP
jgi:hypothetical protein